MRSRRWKGTRIYRLSSENDERIVVGKDPQFEEENKLGELGVYSVELLGNFKIRKIDAGVYSLEEFAHALDSYERNHVRPLEESAKQQRDELERLRRHIKGTK